MIKILLTEPCFGKAIESIYLSPAKTNDIFTNRNKMFKLLKKSALALLFILPFLVGSQKAEATHYMGADITYKCIDSFKFEVTLKWYRDCRGVSLSNSPLQVKCSNGSSQNVTLTLISIREITPICATATGGCSPQNTYGSGEGVEEHTYRGTLDFNTSPLSALKNCTGKITFGSVGYARNGSITTGAANYNLWTDAELDLKNAPCNNSPTLTSEPIAILCCNQPFFFNNGAVDNIDNDSLSYAWGHPRSAVSTNIGYGGNWSYNYAFSAYDPRNPIQPNNPIPSATPPIGVYLNPVTGDIIFTPVNCSEVTVAVINVTEWRKDTAGVYKVIGRTQRDVQFIVKTCADNNPPIVNGPYAYSVCEGSQLCFNVTTNDVTFQPPPPASAPPADTVTTSWNAGIPGASFTILNPTGLHQTGQFCWTPGAGTASDLPYNFTVTARDNACPLNAVAVRAFRVTVKHRAKANRTRDTLPCGVYAVKSNPVTGFRGTPGYTWNILDSTYNIVTDRKIAKFKFSGNYNSNKRQDTLIFTKGGTYIIEHIINNAPNNCPTSYYDTLVVPPLLEADLSLGADTFLCAGSDLLFRPIISNYTPPLTYQWSTMGVTNNGKFLNNATSNASDDKDTFRLYIPNVQYDTAVSVFISDGIGCTAVDSVQVFLKANPLAILPADTRICTYEDLDLIPDLSTAFWIDPIMGDTLAQGDTLAKEWYFNGSSIPFSIADSININIAGQYVLKVVDSLNCADTDTFNLFVNDTVTALAGLDKTYCFKDTVTLTAGGIDTAGNGKSGLYIWKEFSPGSITLGTKNIYKQVASTNKEFKLELFITQSGKQCYDSDTVKISVNQLPVIKLTGPKDLCCDYGVILMNSDVITPAGIPATGGWSVNSYPYLMQNNTFYTDSACAIIDPTIRFINVYAVYTYTEPTTTCVNKDSIKIRVNSLPSLILTPKTYCQDKLEVDLDADIVLSPANTSLGTPSWRCLDSNSTANEFINKMLVNKGTKFSPKFWLNVDEASYTIQNSDGTDTIVLEFSFINPFGCRNKDTVNIIIAKVPKITFSRNRDLCWDEGKISLDSLTGVNLSDGIWSCQDIAGFRKCSELGSITGDTINTRSSLQLANVSVTPNQWKLRYDHTASGCPAFNEINIRINPLPKIILTNLSPDKLCETNADVSLDAKASPNPTGGTWSTTDPTGLIGGNTYSPANATIKGSYVPIYYRYTSPSTGCKNIDSIKIQIDPKPIIYIPNNQEFCRTATEMTKVLTMPVTADFSSGVTWGVVPNKPSSSRTTLGADPKVGTVTLTLQNNNSDTFRMYTNAGGLGACSSDFGNFQIIVHPIPDASITNDNPDGCNPVTSNFGVIITNSIDPTTVTYNWNIAGAIETSANPSATFNTDGAKNISVRVTSLQGCDTTLTETVEVYPIPVALFEPNPNNYTTAALPRFTFNNKSTVANLLNATITKWEWDFGDLLTSSDTSTETNPTYYFRTDTGTYIVTLRVTTNHGCSDEFEYPVIIGPDLIVFIPNAFTPDLSGPTQNEGFSAIISGELQMELNIFNRWGEILFQTTEVVSELQNGTIVTKSKPWNGEYRGVPVQQDVYAYTLKVTALNNKEYEYSGTLTLIR